MWFHLHADSNRRLLLSGREEEDADPPAPSGVSSFNITPPTHRLSVTAALSQWQFTFSSTPSNWTLTSATVDLMEFNPFLQDHLTCRRLHLPAASSLRQTNKGQRRVKFKDYSRWLQNSLGMGMVGTDQKNRRCMKDERASFSLHSYIKHTGSSWSVLQ